jgi:hypothetical protein
MGTYPLVVEDKLSNSCFAQATHPYDWNHRKVAFFNEFIQKHHMCYAFFIILPTNYIRLIHKKASVVWGVSLTAINMDVEMDFLFLQQLYQIFFKEP